VSVILTLKDIFYLMRSIYFSLANKPNPTKIKKNHTGKSQNLQFAFEGLIHLILANMHPSPCVLVYRAFVLVL